MRRIALPLAAAALAATAPLALGSNGPAGLTKPPAVTAGASTGYQSHAKATTRKARAAAASRRAKAERRKRARRAKPVNLVLTGCVVDDATASSVEIDTLAGNAHMRRLLAGAEAFTAPLGASTRVVLSEAARADRGVDSSLGSNDDIWAGDRIVVRWRLPRGSSLTTQPALRVVNQGPHDDCLPDEFEDEFPDDGDWGDDFPEEEPVEEEPDDSFVEPAEGGGGGGHGRRGSRR